MTLPGGRLDSVWPVLVVPAVIIGLAAVAGHLAGELVTLAFGIATVSGLSGFLAYRVLGRRWPWLISACVCAVAIPLFGLGLIRTMDSPDDPTLPVTAAPSVRSALPLEVNAGRPGAFQDHMRLRILKGRSMKRVAHLVVSVMSRRPIRWMAPTARLRSAAMTRGPEPVRAVELSSR